MKISGGAEFQLTITGPSFVTSLGRRLGRMQRGFATDLRGVFAGVFVPVFALIFVRIFMPRFWGCGVVLRWPICREGRHGDSL